MKIINNRWLQLVAFLLVVSAITGGDINGLELPVLIVILVITVPAIRRRVGLDRLDSLLKQKKKKSNIASSRSNSARQANVQKAGKTSIPGAPVIFLDALDDNTPEPFIEYEDEAAEKGIAFAPDGIAEPLELDEDVWERGYSLRLSRGTWIEIYLADYFKRATSASELVTYFGSEDRPSGVTAVYLADYQEYGQITCYLTPSSELPSFLDKFTSDIELGYVRSAESVTESQELKSMTAYEKFAEACRADGEDPVGGPLSLSSIPEYPEEVDTPIHGLYDYIWERGYYKEVEGGIWYEMYLADEAIEGREDRPIDAKDEDGEYYWGALRFFHGIEILFEYKQINFFVPDGETYATLDEMSDIFA